MQRRFQPPNFTLGAFDHQSPRITQDLSQSHFSQQDSAPNYRKLSDSISSGSGIIIRHVCVEGWDYIGQWSGPNLRAFLTRVGADLTAKYVYFICNDEFTESIDMASALHPQTILATKYAGQLLTDPFGYPLRLRTTVKLGYKNAKWINAIEVTNTFRETFWSKQGENWFAGI
jgi:DMSO/TMAO reductase YedYZ molybdopterin-dependent catalytic subunit